MKHGFSIRTKDDEAFMATVAANRPEPPPKATALPSEVESYRALGFALVPCRLQLSGDGKSKEMARRPPKHADWRTVDHLHDLYDANAWLALIDGWIVLDADSEAATRWVERMISDGIRPRADLIVRTHKGRHFYYRKDGKWHRNQRGIRVGPDDNDVIDVIDLSSNGVFCAGSWHPVAKRAYSVIRWQPNWGGALSESTLTAALRIPDGKGHAGAGACEVSKTAKTVSTADKGRHDILWDLARDMGWDQGIRNRKTIDIAVRARNRKFDDPLPEKAVPYISYAIGFGNRDDSHPASNSQRLFKKRQARASHGPNSTRKPPRIDNN